MLMGHIYEKGEFGVGADAVKAYAWYSRASAQGYAAGQEAASRIEPLLTPEQREHADGGL